MRSLQVGLLSIGAIGFLSISSVAQQGQPNAIPVNGLTPEQREAFNDTIQELHK